MEAIIRHSPIPCNGPICSTYGTIPYEVRVYCTCCAKGSKAKCTAAHAHPAHRGSGGFYLPVLAARHPHTEKKKGLPIIPFRIFKTYRCGLAQFIMKIYFFSHRVEGLPLFTAP